MKNRGIVIAMLLALANGAPGAEEELQLEPGFTRLDTGKDLEGWIVRPGFHKCFTAREGNIHVADIAGGPRSGRLDSAVPHGPNVVIRLQYRAAAGADSGVFFWGRQFQVRDYENSLPDTKRLAAYDKPAGQWNDLEFEVNDGKATVRLNGQVVVTDWQIGDEPERGFGLQKEVGEFDFRFIRMRQSGSSPASR